MRNGSLLNVELSVDNSEERIAKFLESHGHDFVPPLRYRVDFDAYCNKLAEKADNLWFSHAGADIGHAAVYVNDLTQRRAFISSFCVASTYRGTGIAERLIEAVFGYCRQRNFKDVRLEVGETNIAARRFYERVGFLQTCKNDAVVSMSVVLDKHE